MGEVISLYPDTTDAEDGERPYWQLTHGEHFILYGRDETGAFAIVGDPPGWDPRADITPAMLGQLNCAYAEAEGVLAAIGEASAAWAAWKLEGRRTLCLEMGRRVLLLGKDAK